MGLTLKQIVRSKEYKQFKNDLELEEKKNFSNAIIWGAIALGAGAKMILNIFELGNHNGGWAAMALLGKMHDKEEELNEETDE